MLIGSSSHKPDVQTVRRIKSTLHTALNLSQELMITVAQLACLEEECAPLETVIGLLGPELTQTQYKIHKSTDAINVDDLMQVCKAWGYDVPRTTIDLLFKE